LGCWLLIDLYYLTHLSKIRIHTSILKGSGEESGKGLGERRARAVERFLVTEGGVAPGRLRVEGTDGGTAGGTAAPRSQQRRQQQQTPAALGQSLGGVRFSVLQELKVGGTIEFRQMSSSFQSDAATMALLRGVARLMRAGPTRHACLRIEGHSDDRPSWGMSNEVGERV
jgi:outer membrane protein OmpA-like peptidoglycan-associated protein